MSELSISLNIAGRPYKLKIDKESEETFRAAAKLIDSRINEYSSNYTFKDKQDLLAMVALEYTVSFLRKEHFSGKEDQLFEKKLEEVDIALAALLESTPKNVL